MTEKKDEKGQITADISDDAVREALKSVERRKGGQPEDSPDEGSAGEAETVLKADLERASAALEDSQARSRDLMDKIRDTHDRMLRAVADLENFKKRASKEKDDVQKFGTEKLIKELLPVMDNLERTLDAAKTSRDVDVLLSGVQLVLKLFEGAMGKVGVAGQSAVGKPFDPTLMEAMMQKETAEVPPNTVVSELAKGYTIHGRLVRPAAVVVARAPKEAAEPPAAVTGAGEPTGGNGA